MTTRFQLEEQIMSCWNICDELAVVADGIESDDLSREQAVAILRGLQELYQVKFERAFDTFENSLRENYVRIERAAAMKTVSEYHESEPLTEGHMTWVDPEI